MNEGRQTFSISYRLFVALWVLAFLAPFVVNHWSRVGGVIAGVVIPLVWLNTMPCTCMNGALVASLLATMQVASMLSWLVIGFKRFFG